MQSFIDPELALCALNTITRKAEVVNRGSVTEACIRASEAVRDRAIYRRAAKVYEMLKAGRSLEEPAAALDEERRALVEKRGSAALSGFTGKEIRFRFTEIAPHARRTDPFTAKYWGFDPKISYDIGIDGKDYHIENLTARVVPEYALQGKGRENPDMGTAIFVGAVLTQEMQYIGHTIINMVVPAAVAAALGTEPADAAKKAAKGAYLTNAIAGGLKVAEEVAKLAREISTGLNEASTETS